MSGHSKWATIKHKKGAIDAKRGKLFTKLIKELTVAARMGGGDPGGNPRLRKAIADAKGQSMPNDTIQRAIKRGTGEIEGAAYEEVLYEGTGPGGTLYLVEGMTDNRNRTVAAIRNLFTRAGGSLGETGSVAWMFTQQGVIRVAAGRRDPDEIALELLDRIDVGEDGDISVDGRSVQVTLAPGRFEEARHRLETAGYDLESAEVTMNPSSSVALEPAPARAVLRLLESLEEHDDVQQVYANAEIPDDILESVGS